jgi:hypothetical protein
VDKDGGIQLFRRFPDNVERTMIQIPAIRAMAMFVWIDMCADFDATQTELTQATFELLRGEIDILQRDRPETYEAIWIFPDNFCDVIV